MQLLEPLEMFGLLLFLGLLFFLHFYIKFFSEKSSENTVTLFSSAPPPIKRRGVKICRNPALSGHLESGSQPFPFNIKD